MAKHVLLLGRRPIIVDDVQQQLNLAGVTFSAGTSLDDVRQTFDAGSVDAVIIGAGLDLETRLAVVRLVIERSQTTTVHLKDRASGPAGMLPFVRSVLTG